MKMTRRKLAAVLASATVAAAQQPAAAPTGDLGNTDLVKTARERMLANARALATPAIPIATEPAFQFRA